MPNPEALNSKTYLHNYTLQYGMYHTREVLRGWNSFRNFVRSFVRSGSQRHRESLRDLCTPLCTPLDHFYVSVSLKEDVLVMHVQVLEEDFQRFDSAGDGFVDLFAVTRALPHRLKASKVRPSGPPRHSHTRTSAAL